MPWLTALCPPAGEFLPEPGFAVTGVPVPGIIELQQDPVIEPAFYEDLLPLPVLWMESSHHESVVDVALLYAEVFTGCLCGAAKRDAYRQAYALSTSMY